MKLPLVNLSSRLSTGPQFLARPLSDAFRWGIGSFESFTLLWGCTQWVLWGGLVGSADAVVLVAAFITVHCQTGSHCPIGVGV